MIGVAVVGGGLAGLFVATELSRRGIDNLVVLERADAAGGVARTIRRDGYRLEPAAGSVSLPHPHLSPILDHLSVEMVPATGATVRHIHVDGRLVTLRPGPGLLTAPIAPIGSKLRAAAEFAVPPGSGTEETLDEFMQRRFGADVGGLGGWLAASGVYAGDPEELSAEAAFPRLTALEAGAGSVLGGIVDAVRSRPPGTPRPTVHIPADGMDLIGDAAAELLGDRLRTRVDVERIERAGAGWRVGDVEARTVILAVRPRVATGLLGGDAAALLRGSVSAPVAVVWLGGPEGDFPVPAGFGVLTGPDAGTATRGVLFESSYAPHRAPPGHSLVKAIAGGHPRRAGLPSDDGALVRIVGSEVARILSSDVDASFTHVVRHRPGIPQYTVGHAAWLDRATRGLPDGVHLAGWAYRGVGVAHLASDAVRLADTIAAHT